MRYAPVLLVLAACLPPQERVVDLGRIQISVHTGTVPAPWVGIDRFAVRVLSTDGLVDEESFLPSERWTLPEVDGVGSTIEVVLDGFSGPTLTHTGSTGWFPIDAAGETGLFFGRRRTFVELDAPELRGRWNHATVRLADGRVVVGGGRGVSVHNLHMPIHVYDPRMARFSLVEDLSPARELPSAARLGEAAVAFLGGTDETGTPLRHGVRYEPGNEEVAQSDSALRAARGGACAVWSTTGHLVVAGGNDAQGARRDLEFLDRDLHTYQVATLPGRGWSQHSCAPLADGIAIVGGTDEPLGAVEVQPGEMPEQLPELPLELRRSAAVASPSGPLFFCGNEVSPVPVRLRASGASELAAEWSLGLARIGCTATRLRDNSVLVVGGIRSGATLRQSEVLDGDHSTPIGADLAHRSGHTADLLPGGEVLLVGGPDAPVEIYIP